MGEPDTPRLTSSGNPQIPKGEGDGPVQAYIAAMPGWKADVGRRLDGLVARVFPEAVRISTRMSANRRDRLTSRLPMLSPPHPEGGVGAIRVEVRGRHADGSQHTAIAGIAEQVGTAAAATAVAFADAAVNGALPTGVVVAGDDRLDTLGLLHVITRLGVRLQDFTGEANG